MTDVDRLRREMETLWGPDAYGRPSTPHPLVAIAVAGNGQAVRFGPAWPDGWARPLEPELLAFCAGAREEGGSPPGLEAWRARLDPSGTTEIVGGPSYVFDAEPVPPASPFRIVASDEFGASDPKPIRPEPWGDDAEWAELLVGRLGPWALALDGDLAVSVCYTPVASATAAEAGVWTLPAARGQGLAGAVTAAWARAAAPVFGTLFYSTSFGNAASQAVARKLGLRPIGHVWQLVRL